LRSVGLNKGVLFLLALSGKWFEILLARQQKSLAAAWQLSLDHCNRTDINLPNWATAFSKPLS
jgi:hypothetical protein